MMRTAPLALALLLAAGGARAGIRAFSYDPANDDTRALAGPVTVVVYQTMLGVRVLKFASTVAKATTDLARADGLDRDGYQDAIGAGAPERLVYRILPEDQGPDLIAALCPGSKRGWLALTRVKYGHDLQAVVLGDNPAGGPIRRCKVLDFTFHGEWKVPDGTLPPKYDLTSPPDFPN